MNRLRKLAYSKPAIIKNRATCYRGPINSKEYAEVQCKRALFLNVRFGSVAAPQDSTIPAAAIQREAEVRSDFFATEI